MKRSVRKILLGVVPAIACVSAGGPAHAAASPFDGSWQATLDCMVTRDGLGKPFSWDLRGDVRNGFMTMQHGRTGMQNSGTLTGKIGAGGDAMLHMNGIAGDPSYNIGNVKAGSPIHFSASVHFDATRGDGARNEGRDCALHFIKQ